MQTKEKAKCGWRLGQMQTEFTTQLWFEVFCLIHWNNFFNIFKTFVLGWLLANANGFFVGEGGSDSKYRHMQIASVHRKENPGNEFFPNPQRKKIMLCAKLMGIIFITVGQGWRSVQRDVLHEYLLYLSTADPEGEDCKPSTVLGTKWQCPD